MCKVSNSIFQIFNNSSLTEIVVYGVDRQKCLNNQSLFINIVSLRVDDTYIDLDYLAKFKNLQTANVTLMYFHNLRGIIALLKHFCSSVRNVYVVDSATKEQLDVAKSLCCRDLTVIVQHKRSNEVEADVLPRKRVRTPSLFAP
ncbi:hypothetical protein MBANPS3_004782 [Mucor bainieri]